MKRQLFAKLLALSTLAASVAAQAQAVNPADGLAAVTSLQGSGTGYGPVMYGLAITTVGVMIALKWIKRAKNAA